MKNQKGITLIALIITIIIMLILVGVTINYSLNGGLITKAKEAGSGMQIEADKETLMMAALGTINTNGELDLSTMETPDGFTKVSVGQYTKGDYTYVVNPSTGAVSARKTSGEGGENDSGSGSGQVEERTVVGTYSTYIGDNGELGGTQCIIDLDENGNVNIMLNSEVFATGKYTFNENTNTVLFTDMEGESADNVDEIECLVLFFSNNRILGGEEVGMLTSNGFAGFEEIPAGALGTYVDENENQLTVVRTTTSEMLFGANLGEIQYIQGGSNAADEFAYIDGKMEYFFQDIEFSQDYSTLTKDGIIYTKIN